MARKEVILLASLGRTDLQVVLEKEGRPLRASVNSGVRAFHEALLQGAVPFVIAPDAAEIREGRREEEPGWDGARQQWRLPAGCSLAVKADGGLTLAPAKLAGPLAALENQPDLHILSVVLFATCRDERAPEPIFRNEPVAAGPLLAAWLAQRWGLEVGRQAGEVGPGRVGWVNILDGKMLSPASGRDALVNREALRRVEAILRQAASWGEGLWACLSLGGGMPEFKEPIKACAGFHFEGRTFNWQAPQFSSEPFVWVNPDAEPPTPADSYRVRRHVVQLIRRGAFSEAYGAASELEGDEKECRWVSRVRGAADYLAGTLDLTTHLPPYLKTLLNPWTDPRRTAPRCLLVGARAEAALWARRLPEALSWTCTFLDAALHDAIDCWLPKRCFLDNTRGLIGCPRAMESQFESGCEALGDRERPVERLFETPQEIRYGYKTMGAARDGWLQLFEPATAEAWANYRNALDTEQRLAGGRPLKPVQLRHITVHGLLKPREMRWATEVFESIGLWNKTPQLPGDYFLGQPLAADLLNRFGVPNAAALYRTLVDGLIIDLRDYSLE